MSNRAKKTLTIILLCVILAIAITVVVLRSIFPEQTVYYIKMIWDYLNKPLPVVGVSTLVIGFFLLKMFKNSSFGKKQINEFKRRAEQMEFEVSLMKQKNSEAKKEFEDKLSQAYEEINYYKSLIKKICEVSPNAKIRAIGEKVDGKETVDDQTKAK